MSAACGTNAGFHAHVNRHEPPCQECKNARAERERANRAKRLARGFAPHEHGSNTAWDSGCRCDICTSWHRQLFRDYYDRTNRRSA